MIFDYRFLLFDGKGFKLVITINQFWKIINNNIFFTKIQILFVGSKDDNCKNYYYSMIKLSWNDLQILHLGIKGNGRFDEKDIEFSKLRQLGTGRILDQLASLQERNLIDINKDGSFSISKKARQILWDSNIPLMIRILRILEIKSQRIDQISLLLQVSNDRIEQELEKMQIRHLVLMSPLRTDLRLEKMYEIMPDGAEFLKNPQDLQSNFRENNSQIELLLIVGETIREIKDTLEIPNNKKEKIIKNLLKIKEKLESG